jgi:hypothetical protein
MTSGAADPADGTSSDERDTGWGGREWAEGGRSRETSYETADSDSGDEDPDLERLRADRPPHHEDRDR